MKKVRLLKTLSRLSILVGKLIELLKSPKQMDQKKKLLRVKQMKMPKLPKLPKLRKKTVLKNQQQRHQMVLQMQVALLLSQRNLNLCQLRQWKRLNKLKRNTFQKQVLMQNCFTTKSRQRLRKKRSQQNCSQKHYRNQRLLFLSLKMRKS